MRTTIVVLLSIFALSALAGCAAQKPAKQAYIVDQNGQVSVATRSALDGSPAPGRQEIIAFYLPPIPGIPGSPDFRAGITADPSEFQFPIIISPPLAAPTSFASPCAGPQTLEVEESYQVPETRMVTKTRMVKRVVLPVPQAAPVLVPNCAPAPQTVPYCAPAPQAAPAPRATNCPEPVTCLDPEHCGVPTETAAK